MNYKSYSKENQDVFVNTIHPRRGFFLDIGCRTPEYENNTKLLEEVGWNGLMFDIDPEFAHQCQKARRNMAFPVDVTSQKFLEILEHEQVPQLIDYVSMDVDEASFDCLKALIDDGYIIGCMTFEHTWNLKDDFINKATCKAESRALLRENGYVCLFADVTLPLGGEHGGKAFEDWWIHPVAYKQFSKTLAGGLDHDECIRFLENHSSVEDGPVEIHQTIHKCAECNEVSHSGAFTEGGAKPICGHYHSSQAFADRADPFHWKHRVVDPENTPPAWCPLRQQ